MNKLFSTASLLISLITTHLNAQPGIVTPQIIPPTKKIQVAILFDASNSMDGLLDQAKSKLWNIVNEISSFQYEGNPPTIEIALYEYGNNLLSEKVNYVWQLVPFTTDLDLISQKLFGITTNGGNEYCGAVIQASLTDLNWSTSTSDLKMIFIAGNEPFNQGPIDYKVTNRLACERKIYVNTIYCGPRDQGIREFWMNGAEKGCGDYFSINSDEKVQQINTPYDAQINQYNDSLNQTYIMYGTYGKISKENQVAQDNNAKIQSPASITERAIVKSKKAYNNASWDLIDAVEQEGKNISEIKEEELPEEFKGKTDEEKQQLLETKKKEREKFQNEIAELAKKREEYIQEELKKKNPEENKDDFGTSVNSSISKKAMEIGFKK